MFLALDSVPSDTLRPSSSNIRQEDWEILAGFWHPIARTTEVGEEPLAARLLDVELLVFRGESAIAVTLDRCPHRHIRLSGGTVENGQIVCPYHKLAFDETGRCTKVPALGRAAKLPPMYKVDMFPVVERYGLVWTCLRPEAGNELPTFPHADGLDESEILFIKTRDWPVSSARQIENFVDLAHLPFVHAATLGGDENAKLTPGKIEQYPDGVTLRADYIETPFNGQPRTCEYTYRVVLPFAIELHVHDAHGHDMRLHEIASPTSAYSCRVFQFVKNEEQKGQHKQIINGLDTLNQEDMALLEGLTMPDLPLNFRHEIHLPVDNISHAYRERLRGLGLGKPAGAGPPDADSVGREGAPWK